MIRRPIEGALLAMLMLLANGIAAAEAPHESLRGTYSLTFTRTCAVEGPELIVPPGPGGARTGIGGGGVTGPFTLSGLVRYDEAGGGTFTGQHSFASGTGPVGTGITTSEGNEIFVNQAAVTCTLTYAVNPDGSFTQQLNCTAGFTTGPNTGQIATLNGIAMDGQLSPEGSVLLLSQAGTARETFTPNFGATAGVPQQRICNGSGMATSLR